MSRRYAFAVALLAVATTACTSAAAPGWNEFIVYPLINALVFLYDIVRDFGVAIVVLTIVLRLALYPLFLQQLRSTRAQQEIAPALAELKKRVGNDRQKLAEEQMKLYRERGVSPVSGCLPLLIQMPILFGLYSALAQVGCGPGAISNAAHCPGITGEELGRILYPFVPNPIGPSDILSTISMLMPWGRGLAHPDNLITIPGINFSTGIYPMIAAATTLVSSLMTAPAKQPATDDPTARTMGMMVWYTPIITLLFGSQVQAGLSLYWVVTTLFSIVQQWLTSGWGRLGAMIPWLPEHLPSPAAPAMRQEEREIEREAERDLSTVPARSETRNERRRRKRRR
jgi:YidC/Oxa1 family membrane protein insertase